MGSTMSSVLGRIVRFAYEQWRGLAVFHGCLEWLEADRASFHARGCSFIVHDDFQSVAERIGIKTHSDCGSREGASRKDAPYYKCENLQLFTAHGIQWLVSEEHERGLPSVVFSSGLLPREREMIRFLDSMFPPQTVF